MLEIEVDDRSGDGPDAVAVTVLARAALTAEGVRDGELGVVFVTGEEIRALKRDHLGIDEVTDVLSFPLDGAAELPVGEPRAIGDVVICPAVVGDAWRWPLVHGILHVLGYEHGPEMEAREQELLA
jgi:rRNA maturation RNase YbeY